MTKLQTLWSKVTFNALIYMRFKDALDGDALGLKTSIRKRRLCWCRLRPHTKKLFTFFKFLASWSFVQITKRCHQDVYFGKNMDVKVKTWRERERTRSQELYCSFFKAWQEKVICRLWFQSLFLNCCSTIRKRWSTSL